ncbi:hypothetical protein [Niallia circulans]|uniref:hypothetical protein n=1 Tax=Niallia circulans TaxID=1397 RepID=UPI00201DA543|nr:hypothetical protein [Niallia circulans]
MDEKKVAVWKSRDKWGQDNKDNVVQQKRVKQRMLYNKRITNSKSCRENRIVKNRNL